MTLFDRLAGAPISWGVCEVPGWGRQLPPARVVAEMAELGLVASELGPAGYLGDDPAAITARLGAKGLRAVAGFVPLVLHDPGQRDDTRAVAAGAARLLSAVGADVFVTAVVVDAAWSPRVELDAGAWRALADGLEEVGKITEDLGLRQVLHPHAGTLVETAVDVRRMLDATDVPWCLDTGHLAIGGFDPAAFVRDHSDRVGHVHLKDVRLAVAERYRSGELSLMAAVQHGLFCPLGQGDVSIAEVVNLLERAAYQGWYVLEQDVAVTGDDPAPGYGPAVEVRKSIAYLHAIASGAGPTQSNNHTSRGETQS